MASKNVEPRDKRFAQGLARACLAVSLHDGKEIFDEDPARQLFAEERDVAAHHGTEVHDGGRIDVRQNRQQLRQDFTWSAKQYQARACR